MPENSFASPQDPAYFAQADRDFEEAARSLDAATNHEVDTRESLRQTQSKLAERAAEIQMNGGTQTVTIDGSNAEKRKAQLEAAIASDRLSISYATSIRQLERALALAQAAEVSASNRLSRAKRRMDYAIAFVQQQTALTNVGAYLPPLQFNGRPKIRTGGPLEPTRVRLER